MPGLYRDEGVVLRAIKLGEADRIVTIFTQGHGKVRAVAKGIRKTTSKFGARLEPTTRVALQCYKGRDLDIVTQAESLDSNRVLREEYALLTRSVPMLEAVDQVDIRPRVSGYLQSIGFGYDEVVALNPSIVYTNCYGYRRGGPDADLTAYDDTIQAECGVPFAQQKLTGVTSYVATIMADKVAGLDDTDEKGRH